MDALMGGSRMAVPVLTCSQAIGVRAMLHRGQSVALQLVGSSSGDETDEWFGLLGAKLAAVNPTYGVSWRMWNGDTQWYDLPTSLVTGPAGERYADFTTARLRYSGTAITGDLDVRVKVRPDSWDNDALQIIASRYAAAGNQKSWYFGINLAGRLIYAWSEDGSTTIPKTSTANPAFVAGDDAWLRVVHDVDNGAAGNDLIFYTSIDGDAWTQLGDTVTTAGVAARIASTDAYQLGTLDSAGGSPYNGRIYWAEIRDGIDGVSMVPPMPDMWDQTSSEASNSVLYGGSPTILLINGSVSGQNVAYFDDPIRIARMLSPHGLSLAFLSSCHNDTLKTTQSWITAYSAWVTDVKTLVPGVPIVCTGQGPLASPKSTNAIASDAQRSAALAVWAASQAGVGYVDVWPAFIDTATQVEADGIHPTAAGSAVWRDYMYSALFA